MPKVEPDLLPPDEEEIRIIEDFFERHEQEYRRVWDRLEQVQRNWSLATLDERIGMLKLSFIFAHASIQTAVPQHEEAFQLAWGGDPVPEAYVEAGVQHPNQKADQFAESFADDEVWYQAVDTLAAGNVDGAHNVLIEGLSGIGPAKAAFMLANLGFTMKMCIDTNMAKLMLSDTVRQSKAENPAGKYDLVCEKIEDHFDDHSNLVEAHNLKGYHLQWLLFDYRRLIGRRQISPDAVAKHDVWFDAALSDPRLIRRRMIAQTVHAKLAEFGSVEAAPLTDDEYDVLFSANGDEPDNGEIERAIERELSA